uniref:Peptidase A2 domain-containing protein n=1 Tax=Anopheles minimus TaxID=112268 RepID=A0A182W6A1_9DIPT
MEVPLASASKCEMRSVILWKAYEAAQTKLETLEEDDKVLTDLSHQRNEFYIKHCDAKGFLTSNLPHVLPFPNDAESGKMKSTSNVRLPKLDLPTFDGNTTDWISFKHRFVSMIDKAEDMPDVVKLQYLLSVLKGEVSKRFQHVQLTADNYSSTWKALLERYDNKRVLKREYFKPLFSILPMKNDTIEELRRVSDEFTRLTQGMSPLKEAIDPVGQNPTSDNIVAATTAASKNTTVSLQTALVQVVDDDGSSFDARALLDSGSMPNFISTALANRLTNRKRNASVSIVGIGLGTNHVQEAVDVIIASKTQRFSRKLNFLVLDAPTSQLPTMEVNTNDLRIED